MTDLKEQQTQIIKANRRNRIWTYAGGTAAGYLLVVTGMDIGAYAVDWWTIVRGAIASMAGVVALWNAQDLGRGKTVREYNEAFFALQESRTE